MSGIEPEDPDTTSVHPASQVPHQKPESNGQQLEQQQSKPSQTAHQGGARRVKLSTLAGGLSLLFLFSLLFFFFLAVRQPDYPRQQSSSVAPLLPPDKSSLETTQQPKMSNEQTFIAVKPDGVQRGLIGPIISRFEARGFKLVAIKLTTPGTAHLEKHYADLKDKPFFPGLISYMSSGPICAMVWEGRDAVKTGRAILGATNPLASAPGTIRGDYALDVGRNVCHGSDSVENAKKEIALWFKEDELVNWKSAQFDWIYEKP